MTSGYSGKYVKLCVTKSPKKLVGLEKTAGKQRVKRPCRFCFLCYVCAIQGEYIYATETWISSGLMGLLACMQTLHYLADQQFRLVALFLLWLLIILLQFLLLLL